MDKQSILNKILSKIVESSLVNACFTDEVVMDATSPVLNIYCLTSLEKLPLLKKYQESFMQNDLNLIHFNHTLDCFTTYYDNGLIVKMYTYTECPKTIIGKIYPLFDPSSMLINYNTQGFAFTNLEYAKCFDEFSCSLIDLYYAKRKNDKVLAFSLSQKVQAIFVKIYRAFYDSMNAKKLNAEIYLSMNSVYYNRLMEILKNYKIESFMAAILESIKEVDKIVSVLPINIVTLFNFDFYNYAKQLVMNIN